MKRTESGSTLVGFLAGLITGLVVAVVVAMYITKAPVPFSSKASRASEIPAPVAKPGQDPNLALYPKQPLEPRPALETPAAKEAGAPVPAPEQKQSNPPAAEEERTLYLLQVGAFKNQDDADNLKAKLALLGTEAKISTAEVDGKPLYRVRIGPYRQQEELQAARKHLSENGIEGTIVKQKLTRE